VKENEELREEPRVQGSNAGMEGGRVQKEGEWHGRGEREKADEERRARAKDVYVSCEGGNERSV